MTLYIATTRLGTIKLITGLSVEQVNHLLYACSAYVVHMRLRFSNMTKYDAPRARMKEEGTEVTKPKGVRCAHEQGFLRIPVVTTLGEGSEMELVIGYAEGSSGITYFHFEHTK